MSGATSTHEPLRTLRQRGSVVLGVIAIALGLLMAVLSVFSGEPSLGLISGMLLLAAFGWVLFVRPAVVLTMAGVELRNPFRRTRIPWSDVEDVSPRWNLEVTSRDRTFTAWAIASHIERPRRAAPFGFGRIGAQIERDAPAVPPPSRGTTVGSASQLIETGMSEYAELVAEGDSAVVTDAALTRAWDWLDIACVAVPVLLIVLAVLL